MTRYVALRHLTIGEFTPAPGDPLFSEEDDGRDWEMMVRTGDVRAVVDEPAQDQRDENGDTAEMAEMRKRFDVSYAERGEQIERLQADIAERDGTIAELREKLAALPTLGGTAGENGGSVESAPASSQVPQTSDGAGDGVVANPTFSVKDKGRGWFAIVIDGQEVTKSLRADDVELFPAMTTDEQAAFVEANKPAD